MAKERRIVIPGGPLTWRCHGTLAPRAAWLRRATRRAFPFQGGCLLVRIFSLLLRQILTAGEFLGFGLCRRLSRELHTTASDGLLRRLVGRAKGFRASCPRTASPTASQRCRVLGRLTRGRRAAHVLKGHFHAGRLRGYDGWAAHHHRGAGVGQRRLGFSAPPAAPASRGIRQASGGGGCGPSSVAVGCVLLIRSRRSVRRAEHHTVFGPKGPRLLIAVFRERIVYARLMRNEIRVRVACGRLSHHRHLRDRCFGIEPNTPRPWRRCVRDRRLSRCRAAGLPR